jgi:hypothetical protein
MGLTSVDSKPRPATTTSCEGAAVVNDSGPQAYARLHGVRTQVSGPGTYYDQL